MPDQGKHSERKCGIGGHRDRPTVRRGPPGVQGEKTCDGDEDPAEAGYQWERQATPVSQFAHIELPAHLETGDKKNRAMSPLFTQ